MRRGIWILVAAVCATVVGGLTVSDPASARDRGSTAKKKPTPPAIYNPYPPGILPADLEAEVDRVRHEMNGIFEGTLAAWRALPPPVLSNTQGIGNPPTLQSSGYQAVQILGKLLLFDAFLQGQGAYTLTAEEMAGYELFRGKGNCNSCHLDGTSTLLMPGQTDTGIPVTASQPLFTNFASSNIGLPLNPRVALFYQTTPDPFRFTPNPFGFGYRDLGFGTLIRSGFGSAPNPNAEWVQFAPAKDGVMQVSTARNVAMTPPQYPNTEAGQIDANGKPIPYFQKEFFHNGYIKSLKQLVHFYTTRDVFPYNVTSGHCKDGSAFIVHEKIDTYCPQGDVHDCAGGGRAACGIIEAVEK